MSNAIAPTAAEDAVVQIGARAGARTVSYCINDNQKNRRIGEMNVA
jgi:hypothetical protein